MKALSRRSFSEIYLEYVNEWITVSAMAENYNRPVPVMAEIIKLGKEEYETNGDNIKELPNGHINVKLTQMPCNETK